MILVEAVITCVGYSDFLSETIRENIQLLDNVVVITSEDDDSTQRLCRRHNVHYVATNDHRRAGDLEVESSDTFNKGRLIRRGFSQIGGHHWILHLDADIVLPRKFRRLLNVAHLDQSVIYGADRQDVVGWDAWQKLKLHSGSWDNHAFENAHWFHPKMTVSSRWVSSIHGYVPIGFFQLFHGSALIKEGYHIRNYPTHHGDAARSDVQFALQWDRQKRQIIPELCVLHLTSSDASMGANWKGRKTSHFGPRTSGDVLCPSS